MTRAKDLMGLIYEMKNLYWYRHLNFAQNITKINPHLSTYLF